MFSGITRGLFPVTAISRTERSMRYTVDLGPIQSQHIELGASIAIDGCCQTAVAQEGTCVTFDAIEETLRLTTLGELTEGALVSVERSIKVGDEIGGHEVSGHIIGTGSVAEVRSSDHVFDLRIAVDPSWMQWILHKGFIAVDGSSLTVGERSGHGWFWLHLIPETVERTKLGQKLVGARVNIEPDPKTMAVVETVERILAQRGR